MTYIYRTVFLILLIIKNFSDQFWVYLLGKMFLYFGILTWAPTWNLGYFALESCI